MMYKVLHPFNMFFYNDKRHSHKIMRFDVGDTITETIKNRISADKQSYYVQPLS